MLKVEPFSCDDELMTSTQLNKSIGKGRLIDFEERLFRSGNEGLIMIYEIKDDAGKKAIVKDYFSGKNIKWKIAKLLAAVGCKEDSKLGEFDPKKYKLKTFSCEIFHEEFYNNENKLCKANRFEMMPLGDEWTDLKFDDIKIKPQEYDNLIPPEMIGWPGGDSKPDPNVNAPAGDRAQDTAPAFDDDIPF